MKKFRDYSIYAKISVYAFLTAVAVLIVARLLNGADDLWALVKGTIKGAYNMFYPFILGAIVAYIFTPAVRGICKLLYRAIPRLKEGAANGIAVALLYLGLGGALAFIVGVFVPGLVSNIIDFSKNANNYYIQVSDFLENDVFSDPIAVQVGLRDLVHRNLFALSDTVQSNISNIMGNVLTGLMKVALSVSDAAMGILLSVYMLISRKSLSKFFKNLSDAMLGRNRSARWLGYAHEVDVVFGRYISAKLLESLIVSIITIVAFLIAGVRYNALLGVMVGLFNLIPYIGALISGTAVLLLTLLDSPDKALTVLTIILVVQTLDNILIGPKLFGKSVGMSAFWALTGVLLGGAMFGVPGMVLGVPFLRVAQMIYMKIAARLEVRRANAASQPKQ